MDNYDVIVIGAGISGMSFAHYTTKAGKKVLVLEKEQRIGGSFHTAKMMDFPSGFWIELGAHTCYNSYSNLIEMMEDCGITGEISPRAKVPFRLFVANKVKSFVSQISFVELLFSIPRAFSKKKRGETVRSYYGSILGKRNFKKVFSALFSAVPSQNADDFPADALFKKRERRKDVLKHFTMKNGLESIVSAITAQDGIDVKNGVEIESIQKEAESFTVKTNIGKYTSRHLAICTSVNVAPELLVEVSRDLAHRIALVQHQRIESMGVVISKEASNLKPFAGLVPVQDFFYSVVSRDTIPNDNYRGFTFHFKPGMLTKVQKTAKICEVLGIDASSIIESTERTNIVPSLRLGHDRLIERIDGLLKGKNLFLSGNYFAGLSIEDCVSRSKAEVARMMQN